MWQADLGVNWYLILNIDINVDTTWKIIANITKAMNFL